eukprot:979806-Pyramimonas_sp.AAC.1
MQRCTYFFSGVLSASSPLLAQEDPWSGLGGRAVAGPNERVAGAADEHVPAGDEGAAVRGGAHAPLAAGAVDARAAAGGGGEPHAEPGVRQGVWRRVRRLRHRRLRGHALPRGVQKH